jgi:hypothetical protein
VFPVWRDPAGITARSGTNAAGVQVYVLQPGVLELKMADKDVKTMSDIDLAFEYRALSKAPYRSDRLIVVENEIGERSRAQYGKSGFLDFAAIREYRERGPAPVIENMVKRDEQKVKKLFQNLFGRS